MKFFLFIENSGNEVVRVVVLIATVIIVAWLAFTSIMSEAKQEQPILRFQKGTYLGPTEAPLSERTREDLRLRTGFQRGTAELPGGGP